MQWRDEKYRVLVTMDGEECVNIYHEGLERARSGKQYTGSKTQPFDAVILDNKMPKQTGWKLTELVDTLEFREIYFALKKHKVDIDVVRACKFNTWPDQGLVE